MRFRETGFSWFALIAIAALLVSSAARAAGSPNLFDQPVLHPAIPLLDEAGQHVVDSGEPYSPKMSCGNGPGGGCHDYGKIVRGYHFEQGRDEADDTFGSKRGLPQLVSPGYFGGYNCMSVSNPGWLAKKINVRESEFGDFGSADLVKECGGCHAGGGWAETDREATRYTAKSSSTIPNLDGDYYSRDPAGSGPEAVTLWNWQRSGVKEADCMLCHADFSALRIPAAEAAESSNRSATELYLNLRDNRFTQAGFFKYAASAIWEFLNVRPDQPEGLSLLRVERQSGGTSAALALDTSGNPKLHWNRDAFDQDGKVRMPMLRFPANENCMVCHKTSMERRGFFGLGDVARAERNPDGTLVQDHRDDVHKSVAWTDDNGQRRNIENCNACHAKQYYKSAAANVDLDADHHFPKGNGDNDVRNDLDNLPFQNTCEYCHDRAKAPALPSGQKNALDAHLQKWKASGDLAGYPAETLRAITQAHLDAVACQTCHSVGLGDAEGHPLNVRYRFRVGPDGIQKIFPYKPAYRYYVQDRVSGRVLYRYERLTVFARKSATGSGETYGAIVDPLDGREVGRVALHDGEFGDPIGYADFLALKQAYDSVLRRKGYARPDVRFVYIESNDYAITHNTRPSPQALQCEDCHARKQSGAFSSLIAENGILGAENVATVAALPDRRLVDEGIVELGMPYYRVHDDGRIVDNVADILYGSRLNPSMTVLNSELQRVIQSELKALTAPEAAAQIADEPNEAAALQTALNGRDVFLFTSKVGHTSLREFALLQFGGPRVTASTTTLRGEVQSRPASSAERLRVKRQRFGNLVSDVYSVRVLDDRGAPLRQFLEGPALIRLPYRGSAANLAELRLVWSANGKSWTRIPAKDIVSFRPRGAIPGQVTFRARRPLAHLAAADKLAPTLAVAPHP